MMHQKINFNWFEQSSMFFEEQNVVIVIIHPL